jgi:propionyl-CoA carboxylase alpha chain
MIKKLLIANRGEIACRIIKTCRRMGIKTVAVYSEADTTSLYVRLADEAVYIGPSSATQSYLNHKRIIDAVKMTGADAVHPGYGFLSENADFANLLKKYGITFVGPSPESIKKMGDKITAKKIAQSANVNVVPGYMGAIKDESTAHKIASKIGYPIMLKAAAGGGGKGMRIVRSKEEMQQALSSTRNEALNNFADERLFIEKFIENPRHIEIQVIGDKFGNYLCLGERECSIQRHHQKVIEEAPSPFIDDRTRRKMYAQAVALAKKVDYFSAGTVEYIVDQDKNFYFLEMNTRIQVEHPVTELVTGLDLVELMIKVANGEKLPLKQREVKIEGWAIEARVYAEDPTCGFLPSTGRIHTYKEPQANQNIRIDSGVYEGSEVSMFYDPMIAKVCSHAPTRDEAINIANEALSQYVIRGVSHNISFLQALLANERFAKSDISTNFIDEEYKDGFAGAELNDEASAVLMCAALFIFLGYSKRSSQINGQLRGRALDIGTRWVVKLDEYNYPVTVRPIDDGYKISFENHRLYITSKWVLGSSLFQATINGKEYSVQIESNNGTSFKLSYMGISVCATVYTPRAAELNKFMQQKTQEVAKGDLIANIAGMVVEVKVSKGESVTKGQPVAVLESMKMENVLLSPTEGVIKAIHVQPKQAILAGQLIIEIS